MAKDAVAEIARDGRLVDGESHDALVPPSTRHGLKSPPPPHNHLPPHSALLQKSSSSKNNNPLMALSHKLPGKATEKLPAKAIEKKDVTVELKRRWKAS